MRILLQTILLLTFIVTSCKHKVESKAEEVNGVSIVNNDTSKSVEITKSPTGKEISDYKTLQKPTITKSDYIDFFNEVLNSKGLVINKKIGIFLMESEYWNSDLMKLAEKSKDSSMSELIDLNDIKFIYEQTESQKNIFLEAKEISRKKVEREYLEDLREKNEELDNYWNEVYKMGSGYYDLELPLFSINKTIALFRYSYSCGSLCANAGTYFYKKINGKWQLIGNIGGELVS